MRELTSATSHRPTWMALPVIGRAAVLALALLWSLPLAAQQGRITGLVTNAATGQPISSAQVFLPELNIGALSASNGRYLLLGVNVGTHTVRVERIGFAAATVEVTVAVDQSVEANFQLQEVALNLDEIVVTGTGAPTQRRRLGQTITSVTSDELAIAPITSLSDALVGRLAGARGLISGGQTGAGSAITLRGTSSISQRQSPLIYVDGVRMDNAVERATSVRTDRLQDINPQDIDRVEVIRGAAAATLYGTEASSGVIQIFTKRGQTGAPVYAFSTDLQHLAFPRDFPDNCGYNRAEHRLLCDSPWEENAVFAYHQNYNLSVRGGTPGLRYYLSGRLMEEVNPSPNNELANQSVRATFDFTHTEKLTSQVGVNVVRRNLKTATPGWGDLFGNLMLGNPLRATETNPHGAYTPLLASRITENLQESVNTMLNASLVYQWADGLSSTLQMGHNFIDSRFSAFFPQGVVAESVTGYKQVRNSRFATTTLDFSTHWETQISDRMVGNVTVGGQSFREVQANEFASVREFGSPTLKTLSGGAQITGVSEGFEEVINAGLFVQGQVGLDDRLFLTGGVRADGNSAFGEDFGLQVYPKAGVSWVVSEYDFWNVGWMNELRLRAALGASGLQPGAFDAQRTWSPSSSVIGGYLTPQNLGNPELKPERSTEIELAVEAGLLDGRFGMELVYFNQTTDDALLPVPPSPGDGFTRSQLRNLGTLKSWGLELTADARLVQTPSFTWDLTLSPTYLKQWADDLGGQPDRRLGSRRRFHSLYEGMWPGIWIAPIVDPNQPYILSGPIDEIRSRRDIAPNILKAADGTDSLAVIGRPQPNWTIDIRSAMQFGSFSFRNIFEAAGGFIVSNETDHLRNALGNGPLVATLEYTLNDPNASVEEKQRLVDEYGRKHNGVISNTVYPGDYVRWAELTVSFQLPDAFAERFAATSAQVSVGAKNLKVFSDYLSSPKNGWIDPGTRGIEAGTTGASYFTQNVDYLKVPAPRRLVFSLRAQF